MPKAWQDGVAWQSNHSRNDEVPRSWICQGKNICHLNIQFFHSNGIIERNASYIGKNSKFQNRNGRSRFTNIRGHVLHKVTAELDLVLTNIGVAPTFYHISDENDLVCHSKFYPQINY